MRNFPLLRAFFPAIAVFLGLPGACGGELEDRHQASPLIAESLRFLPHHPFTRQKPDLQKPWRDVRLIILAGNNALISGYVADTPGRERLVRMSVPTDIAPRPEFLEKIREIQRNKASEAGADQPENPALPPPGWDISQTRLYPNLITRAGVSLGSVHLRALGNGYFEAWDGTAVQKFTRNDLPGPAQAELGAPVECIQAYGLVANGYTRLRSWAEQAGGDYQSMAKEPLPGPVFASLRPGYIVLDMRWKATNELAGVELLKPFLKHRFATIDATSFTSMDSHATWWNIKGVTPALKEEMPAAHEFSEVPPSETMILKDPFNDTEIILANRKREMKRIWAARTGQERKVAIVETEGGYFYGYLGAVEPLNETELNWTQATQEKSGKFELKKVGNEQIPGSKKLFSLLDNTARRSLANPFVTLERARVAPAHLGRILEGGLPALLAEISVPLGDGIEEPKNLEPADSTAGLEIQKITDSIVVYPETWNAALFRFRLGTEQRVREVDHRISGGRVTTVAKAWKKRQIDEHVELSADLDGGVRFTDGRKIFEVLPDRFGKLEMNTWEIIPNNLRR